MNIVKILSDKKDFLDLLLLADPQEDMIDRYLERGDLFALYDEEVVRSVCVVTKESNCECELKNIATDVNCQNKGYASALIKYICDYYKNRFATMYVGTGDSQFTIGFYEKCGFVKSHVKKDFFIEHYDEPIFEEGKQLVDMIYLKKDLSDEVDMHKVLSLALEAGRVLLKNGAEIFRVEETIEHICRHFNIDRVDSFVLSNGIFITAENDKKEVFAKVKHIPLSGFHLEIVTEVNDLSREISAGNIGIDEAFEKLAWIEHLPPKKNYFRILSAGLGSACFCYLLKANIWECVITFFVGMLLYVFVIFAERHKLSKIIVNIVGGALITICALIVGNLNLPFVVTLDKMIIGSILPLVPGVAFINSIRDIANSDFISGAVRIMDALLVFVYIAIGVGFVLASYNNLLGGRLLWFQI